jgi:hypothetical protein
MLIKKILATLDCTEPSLDTNIHPTGLAKGFHATLIAIHVFDPKYGHLSPRPRRLEKILILVRQEAYLHLDNVKQNTQLV